MFTNIFVDDLPHEWNGFEIETDFSTGILISECLQDESLTEWERMGVACNLLFANGMPSDANECAMALKWWMGAWNTDNIQKEKTKVETMNFTADQWRIYSAFLSQYRIDLNTAHLHFWLFMGLLQNLSECALTKVIEIRSMKITSRMTKEQKDRISSAQTTYQIHKQVMSEEEEKESSEEVNDFLNLIKK